MANFDPSNAPLRSDKTLHDWRVLFPNLPPCVRGVRDLDFTDEDKPETEIDEEAIGLAPVRPGLPPPPVLEPGADGVMVGILFPQVALDASLVLESRSFRTLR